MKLFHDDSAGAHSVSVLCYVCGALTPMHRTLIDFDGPAFRAYYCLACVPARARVTKRLPHGTDRIEVCDLAPGEVLR